MFEPCEPLGDYQRDGIQFLCQNHRAALFLPMGTGKSFCVIEMIKYRMRMHQDAFPVLIFTPKLVSRSWEREIRKFGCGVSVVNVSYGTRQQRLNRLQDAIIDGCMVVIANYEFASVIQSELVDFFPMVVCDESTRVKNSKAKRSKAVYEISRHARYRYILTGSPITRGLEDIYGQVYVLDHGQTFGSSMWKFFNRFFSPVDYGPGRRGWVPRSGSMERIKSKCSSFVFKKARSECLTLPEKRYVEITIPASDLQKKAFKEIADLWSIEGKEMFNALAIDTALRQISLGLLRQPDNTFKDYASNKYAAIAELVTDAADQQVIIWTNYIREQQLVVKELERVGVNVRAICGDTGSISRTQTLESYLRGDLPVIVISEQVGAYGLNELANANLIIYSSNSYDLQLRKQSEDRSYRAGRTTSPVYYDLITEGSIEEHILTLLKSKHQLSKAFMKDEVMRRWEASL